jgi:hypothetical protein
MFLTIVTVYHVSLCCSCLPSFSPLSLSAMFPLCSCPCLPFLSPLSMYTIFFSVGPVYHISHSCDCLPCFTPLSLSTMFLTIVTVYNVFHHCPCLPCFLPLSLSTMFFTIVPVYHVSHRCHYLPCFSMLLSLSTFSLSNVSEHHFYLRWSCPPFFSQLHLSTIFLSVVLSTPFFSELHLSTMLLSHVPVHHVSPCPLLYVCNLSSLCGPLCCTPPPHTTIWRGKRGLARCWVKLHMMITIHALITICLHQPLVSKVTQGPSPQFPSTLFEPMRHCTVGINSLGVLELLNFIC